MQKLWSHRGPGRTRPFMLLDELDSAGTLIQSVLTPYAESMRHVVHVVVPATYGNSTDKLPGMAKLDRTSVLILSGVIIVCLANAHMVRFIRNLDTTRVRIKIERKRVG